MKICVAQTRPVKGDIKANIINHKKFIEAAVSHGATVITFPELSLTGYEPSLAKSLATGIEDERFTDLQKLSDAGKITIAVGMPVQKSKDILIGMIVFQPGKARQLYGKQHLHEDELPFFVEGKEQVFLNEDGNKAALAICYEISVNRHAEFAHANAANVYLASVAKHAEGAEKAAQTLAGTARKYAMTILMSNCVGPCDNFISAGRSSVWNDKGILLGELDDLHEGILILDIKTGELIREML